MALFTDSLKEMENAREMRYAGVFFLSIRFFRTLNHAAGLFLTTE